MPVVPMGGKRSNVSACDDTQPDTQPAKRARTATDIFDPVMLADDLAVFAEGKSPFAFDGRDYSKQKKSQGPDREGVHKYSAGLAVVMSHAPNGFPRHSLMKRALEILDERHSLNERGQLRKNWASQAAGHWCTVMKHLADMARCGRTTPFADVNRLISILRGDISKPSSNSSMLSQDTSATREYEDEDTDEAEDEVAILAAVCRCSVCRAQRLHDVDDDGACDIGGEAVDLSQSSIAAAEAPALPAWKGAQRSIAASSKQLPQGTVASSRDAAAPIGKIKKVFRHTKGQENVKLLVNGKYFLSVSKKQSPDYMCIVDTIMEKCIGGTIANKDEALALRNQLLSPV